MIKHMKKILMTVIFIITAVLTLISCGQLDVVGSASVASFSEVLNAIPDNISPDEPNGGWSLAAPDGSVRFIWSRDFSKSPLYDVMLEIDAQPFLDAGLDPEKLPEGMMFENKIIVGTKLGTEEPVYDGEAAPLASYEKIVGLKRESVRYHAQLDHFGIDLAGGNMFEWAKDIKTNDKDIVFALNPQAFIDAGVDPEKLEGWVFARVPVMDENGKQIEVEKFLKPFDLK
jgi:hypothetical protein